MIFIVTGKMASGKTTFVNRMEQLGVHRILTVTTRPKRKTEKETDYKFVSQETFDFLKQNGMFLETAEYNADFGFCCYGSLRKDYLEHKDPSIIVLTPSGISEVRKELPRSKYKVIFLDYDWPERLDRAIKRGDKQAEINRRFRTDDEDFREFINNKEYDYIINDNNSRYHISTKILKRLKKGGKNESKKDNKDIENAKQPASEDIFV